MSATKTLREAALAEVEAHRAVVARWEAEQAAATAELESLQERAGEEVLADESAAGPLSRSMQDLRDRIDIASRAVAAATPRLEVAAKAAVLAEAEEWDAEEARHQKTLDQFDTKAKGLLTALEEFTGLPWAVDRGDYGPGEDRVVHRPVRAELVNAVLTAQRTAWCLREVAEGHDPHSGLSVPFEGKAFEGVISGPDTRTFYPPSVWGPGAVLPAPAYLRAKDAGTTDEPVAEATPPTGPPPGWGAPGPDERFSGQIATPTRP